jgi:hypothetical protein
VSNSNINHSNGNKPPRIWRRNKNDTARQTTASAKSHSFFDGGGNKESTPFADRQTDAFNKNSKLLDSKGLQGREDFSTVGLSEATIADYRKAWQLLASHTVANNYANKSSWHLFNGKETGLQKITSLPEHVDPKKLRPGVFVSKQACIEPSNGNDQAKELKCLVIECDDGRSIEDQHKHYLSLKLPHSFFVWSGGKSLHVWIVLERAITPEEYSDISAKLRCIFPDADTKVLSGKNWFARFPINREPYRQPMFSYNGIIPNKRLNKWLVKMFPSSEAQLLEASTPIVPPRYIDKYFADIKEGRTNCEICKKRGRKVTNTVSFRFLPDGRMLATCYRCNLSPRDKKLSQRRLQSRPTRDPNLLVDLMQMRLTDRYRYNGKTKLWGLVNEGEYLIRPIDQNHFHSVAWEAFEDESNEIDARISEKNFSEILGVLKNRLIIETESLGSGQVALCDGSLIDLRKPEVVTNLKSYTDYFLPLRKEEWMNPPPTPIWTKNLKDHASAEDQILLETFFGYVFSGLAVNVHECCLILHGPSDSGKSTLIELFEKIIPDFSVKISISNCLNDPVQAVNILGKRVALSMEAGLKQKESERFRSLVSGQELTVKKLYEGVYSLPHNCVFVMATNEDAWIKSTPENDKRIRVVKWVNPVSNPDSLFKQKLEQEKAGIIVRCLKAFTPFLETRVPQNSSTRQYMDKANCNVNAVAAWLSEQEITKGKIFCSVDRLVQRYREDTRDLNIKTPEFGRQLKQALGEGIKRAERGKERRGYLISKRISEE